MVTPKPPECNAARLITGWVLRIQDFRPWRPFARQKKPQIVRRFFRTKEQAEAFRATLPKHEDYLINITPASPPRAGKTQASLLRGLGGEMHSVDRKLTP